mgnify:CR=1 FL=1
MNVYPAFGGLTGIDTLQEGVGAAIMFVVVVSVLMLIVSSVAWGVGTWMGNPQTAARGRIGVLVSLGGALMAGAAMTLVILLITYGDAL